MCNVYKYKRVSAIRYVQNLNHITFILFFALILYYYLIFYSWSVNLYVFFYCKRIRITIDFYILCVDSFGVVFFFVYCRRKKKITYEKQRDWRRIKLKSSSCCCCWYKTYHAKRIRYLHVSVQVVIGSTKYTVL